MVSAITQALLQRTATVRKLVQQSQDGNPVSTQTIAQLDEQSKQALDAIDKIERSKVDVVKQRKQLAKERLARLKEQLRLLTMMGGDSKAMARQAAALAREIAAAARSYAGSGNDPAPLAADSSSDGGSSSNDGSSSSSGGDQTASGDAADASGDAAAATGDAEPGAARTAPAASIRSSGDPTGTPASSSSGNRAAAIARNVSDRNHDRSFFKEARNLLAQARRIVKDAWRRDRLKHAKGSPVFDTALSTVRNADTTVTLIEKTSLAAPVVPVALPAAPVRISV
jgi:hypothetical protein